MVEWTDNEVALITTVFNSVTFEDIGPKALSRCLIVYPWCQRYFGNFGNLYNAEAIMDNKMVAAHGIKVCHGLDRALKNMNDIKNTYKELSLLHSDTLNVDPDNFRLFSDCLTISIAAQLGTKFTPEMQTAWQKFLNVVCAALAYQYH